MNSLKQGSWPKDVFKDAEIQEEGFALRSLHPVYNGCQAMEQDEAV